MGLRSRAAVFIAWIPIALVASGLARAAASDDPLAISAPSDVTVAATDPCGQTYCATVTYSYTVTGGTPPYTLVCNLPSGSQFTVGSHTVSCLAQDAHGNSTPSATFTVTVTGGGAPPPPPPAPPPLAISPPGDMTVAATDPCGQTSCATVTYSYTVTGGTPPYTLVCNLPSGSQFTVGSHTVSCLAQDAHGNSTPSATFMLTVTPVTSSGSSGSSGSSSSAGGSPAGGSGSAASSGAGTSAAGSSGSGGTSSGSPTSGTGDGAARPSAPASSSTGSSSSAPASTTSIKGASIHSVHGKQELTLSIASKGAATLHVRLVTSSGTTLLRFDARTHEAIATLTRALRRPVTKRTRLKLEVTIVGASRTRHITLQLTA